MEPQMFGPYRLDELIGHGGMGEVYGAYDTAHERIVAVKLLNRELAREPAFQERFRREGLLAARFSSPHVIPVYDFGEIDGRLYLSMPLVRGLNLAQLLTHNGPLSPERTVDIVAQIADALDAVHEGGLVHRDVKPSNVLVTSQRGRDFVYLVDFGIVRALDGSAKTSLTQTGQAIGTMAYMAPELFNGRACDRRVDVYALGCLMYECLTAQAPFTAEGLGLMYQHLNADPPRPSAQRPGVPLVFDDIVARGMAKNPDMRYSTAGDLADAARRALAGNQPFSPGAPTTTAPSPQQRQYNDVQTFIPPRPQDDPLIDERVPTMRRRRHTGRWAAVAGCVALVGLIAALGVLNWPSSAAGGTDRQDPPVSAPPVLPPATSVLANVFPDVLDQTRTTCHKRDNSQNPAVVEELECSYRGLSVKVYFTQWVDAASAQQWIAQLGRQHGTTTTWTHFNVYQGPLYQGVCNDTGTRFCFSGTYENLPYTFDVVGDSQGAADSAAANAVVLRDKSEIQ
jgi:serine/threonine protein kinase